MIRFPGPWRFATLSVFALLCGCATGPKALAPLTTISAKECAAAPDLSTAAPLIFDGKKEGSVAFEIGDTAPCLKNSAGAALYKVFALPPTDVPYILDVTSVAAGRTLFAPHVMLLASDGSLRRDYAGQAAEFRSTGLSVIVRSHVGEAYLVVASDPAMVGKTTDRILEATQVTTGSTGYATYQIHTGSEATNTYVFAHNGEVSVTLTPLPPTK
ncbi:MAG: hypothetical protein HY243_06200 [Proteobacteria bacterium]|nr:hypothetical protein [Pseudomonadota bacterium]